MFLDPNPVGPASQDGVTFSYEWQRKHYGESRISLAHLDPNWRPWHMDAGSQHIVNAVASGLWVPVTTQLGLASVAIDAAVSLEGKPLVLGSDSCSEAMTILDVIIQEKLVVGNFADFSWALEQLTLLPPFSRWQSIRIEAHADCECAPASPSVIWHVGSNGVAAAQEDRKAAATFERAVKTRPSIFQLKPTIMGQSTRVQVGINVASLLHRARGRLRRSGPSIKLAWRLLAHDTSSPTAKFPRFSLKSNVTDPPYSSPEVSYLRSNQPRSLSWMRAQEQGQRLTVTEVEEAVEPRLGWRVEGQAQLDLEIRGGVLADLPSFGKTVTTISLMQAEYEQMLPDDLIDQNRTLTSALPALEVLAATLIVCPPHITTQWQTELEKFLGDDKFKEYDVLVVQDYAQLRECTMDDFRKTRVVILSWAVFAEDAYVTQLAQFVAMPEPATTDRRAFGAWLTRAMDEIPGRLHALQAMGHDHTKYQQAADKLLKERLDQEEFKATLPVRIQHGKAYQSYNTSRVQSASAKKKSTAKSQSKRPPVLPSASTHIVPLLHLFRFNRLVVDEYYYLNDEKDSANALAAITVKDIAAVKRWVLSGTPALANFSDVDQSLPFLGSD
jgi:hypothetical protein